MSEQKNDLNQLFTMVAMGLTRQVVDFSYKGMNIGRLIFIINYIGYKGECSMKEIIEYLNTKPSTATRKLDKLVEKYHLIERSESKEDRRIVTLRLTELGNEVYFFHKKISEIPANAFREKFSDNEIQILMKGMKELLTILT